MWIEDPDGIPIVLVEVPPVTVCAVTRDRRYLKTTNRAPHNCAFHESAAAQRRPVGGVK